MRTIWPLVANKPQSGSASPGTERQMAGSGVYLDSDWFDGTVACWLQVIVGENADSVARDVIIKDSDGATKATLSVTNGVASGTIVSSLPSTFALTTGGKWYDLYLDDTNANSQLTLFTAVLVIDQTPGSFSKGAVCFPTAQNNNVGGTAGGVEEITSTGGEYVSSPGIFGYWTYQNTLFGGTLTWELQTILRLNSAGTTGWCRLYNNTDGSAITGSEVTHTGDTLHTQLRTEFTLAAGDQGDAILPQIQEDGGASCFVYNTNIVCRIENISKAPIWYPMGRTWWSTFLDDDIMPQNVHEYDSNKFETVDAVTFLATLADRTAGDTRELSLRDHTGAADIAGSSLDPTSIAAAIYESGDLKAALTDTNFVGARGAGVGSGHLYHASSFLVVKASMTPAVAGGGASGNAPHGLQVKGGGGGASPYAH